MSLSITLPDIHSRLLLHSCCATCSGGIIKRLWESKIDCLVLFYNPNIFPEEEYVKRKEDNLNYCKRLGVPFVDLDYDADRFENLIRGFEDEPERGLRCEICFKMRLGRVAEYAIENNFSLFATTLAISRFKNLELINKIGATIAAQHGISYFDYNFRKSGGSELMYAVASSEDFYRQDYCGCRYSVRKK